MPSKHMMLCTAGLAAACALLSKFAELRVTHWQAQQEKHLLQEAEEQHLQANFEKSVTCIDTVLNSNPYHFEALRYRYLLSLNAQTKHDLVKQMSLVAHSDTEKIQAAAFSNLNEGRVQEAVKILEDVAIQTEDWELLIHVVTVLLVNAQPNVANIRRLCDLVISADKVSIMMLAKVYFLKALTCGNANEQIKILTQSIEQYPKCALSLWERAKALKEQNRIDDALMDFQRVLKINNKYAEAYYQIASIQLFQKKNVQLAEEYAEKAIAVEPSFALSYDILLEIYAKKECDMEKAIKVLDRGLAAGCSKPEFLMWKACIYMSFLEFDKAVDCQKLAADAAQTIQLSAEQEAMRGAIVQSFEDLGKTITLVKENIFNYEPFAKCLATKKPPYITQLADDDLRAIQLNQTSPSKVSKVEEEEFRKLLACVSYISCALTRYMPNMQSGIEDVYTLLTDKNHMYLRYACNNAYVLSIVFFDMVENKEQSVLVTKYQQLESNLYTLINATSDAQEFFKLVKTVGKAGNLLTIKK